METVFVFEICAVFSGIMSVWFAKKENILVYPVGIFSVLIWVYLCWLGDLYGQAMVTFSFCDECVWMVQLAKKKKMIQLHCSFI